MTRNSINVLKRPNELGIIPKFSTILLFGLICLCKKIEAGEGSVRMSFRTRRWHFPLSGTTSLLERSSDLQEAYTKNLSKCGQFFLPQHVGAMKWHHAKFHDFQASFEFPKIYKPSFWMFLAEPRCLDVWISVPCLACDLEINPRRHMWFFKQLWCTRACACSSNLNYAH